MGSVCGLGFVGMVGDGLASTTGTKEDDFGQVVVHATQFLTCRPSQHKCVVVALFGGRAKQPTWVPSGIDVSEDIDVLRGLAISGGWEVANTALLGD